MIRKKWILPLIAVLMLALLYIPEPAAELREEEMPAAERVLGEKSTPRININTAGKDLLMELPGIGETLAQRIIDYRAEHGDFEAPEDIIAVNGIGEGKLSQIIDYITTEETP